MDPAKVPAEVEALLADGFRTLKVKVGFDVDADLRRLAAIQQASAGRATLRLDANQAFTREQGCAFATALDPAGIELFEQPCDKADWAANAAVAAVSRVPIMLDESIYGLADIDRAASIPGVGFIKLKLKKLGGISRLIEGLQRIRALGMEPVLGDGTATDIGDWLEACAARTHHPQCRRDERLPEAGHAAVLAPPAIRGWRGAAAGRLRAGGRPSRHCALYDRIRTLRAHQGGQRGAMTIRTAGITRAATDQGRPRTMQTDARAAQLAARLQRIPTTRASWMLVILAAGALVVEALDIGSLSVILPGVRAMWHLTPGQVGMLAAASALGIAIGMIPAGRLADRFGRKRLLVAGVVWFCGGTMLSAAAPNYTALVLIRGLSGLGMAPAFIMPYSIVSEFVSATTRTAFAGLLETALGVGYLLPPLLGILVMPHFASDVGWRVFLVIAGLPVIYVGVIVHYLPESPRWLSRVGRHDEAEEVVRSIERRVESVLGRPLPAPEVVPEITLALSTPQPGPNLAAFGAVWRPPFLLRTIAMICGAFGTFSMFYVGVNYIPSLFVERHMALSNALLFTLVTAAVQIPGKILNGLIAELVGRKAIYAIYTVPAAMGAFMFGRTDDPMAMLGWASLFLFCAAGSAPSYKMWYAEQYPTPIRATGQATVEAIGGRLIGGVIWTLLFPIVVAGAGIATTMTILAGVSILMCVIVVVFAPETRGRSVEALEAAAVAENAETAVLQT